MGAVALGQLAPTDRAMVIAALRAEARAGRLHTVLASLPSDAQTMLSAALTQEG
jgi:uncharacterized protein (DUF2267 family)